VGGLIYEKDVFERLSLWNTNLASSKTHSRQMATGTSTWCVSIYILNIWFVLAWANCVVYPVWVRRCESLCSQDGQRTAPTPFLYTKENYKIKEMLTFGVLRGLDNGLFNYEM